MHVKEHTRAKECFVSSSSKRNVFTRVRAFPAQVNSTVSGQVVFWSLGFLGETDTPYNSLERVLAGLALAS